MERDQALKKLIGCSPKHFKGDTVKEILRNLKKSENYDGQSKFENMKAKVEALEEIIDYMKYMESDTVNEDGIITDSAGIYQEFKYLGKEVQEQFVVGLLDNKHKIIKKVMVTKGTINQSLVHPREVFAPAIEERAAAMILIHNHPSGDPKPSQQDINVTKRLTEVAEIVGIKILDHVIIGERSYFSFTDEDLL